MSPVQNDRTISFTIFQKATGKATVHHTRSGIAYHTKEQRFNADAPMTEMLPFRPPEPITDPVYLIINVTFTVPGAKPKWWREAALAGYIEYDKKPDFDNILKQCVDCLKKLQFFKDDAQVCCGECSKEYGEKNVIEITIIPQHNFSRAEWNKMKEKSECLN